MQLRVATWNIRYASDSNDKSVSDSLDELPDSLKGPDGYLRESGELRWCARRVRVAQILLSQNVDVIGLQEALDRQVDDMQELLGSDWAWVGVGRDDGKAGGEFSPLFYKRSKLTLLSDPDSFWTSETPFVPSKYPDAGWNRIVTAARFQSSADPAIKFSVLNTHFDDGSDGQRRLGASMLRYRAHYEAKETDSKAVIVMGDFNSEATGSTSGGYEIATGSRDIVADISSEFTEKFSTEEPISNFHLVDLRGKAPKSRVSNTFATWTGFTPPNDPSDWQRIDFIFGGSNGGWTAEGYHVLNVLEDDGYLTSDHRPVIVDVSI